MKILAKMPNTGPLSEKFILRREKYIGHKNLHDREHKSIIIKRENVPVLVVKNGSVTRSLFISIIQPIKEGLY